MIVFLFKIRKINRFFTEIIDKIIFLCLMYSVMLRLYGVIHISPYGKPFFISFFAKKQANF